MKPVYTPLQEKFIKCLKEEYSGFAETANIQHDLDWTPRKVAAVGRSLCKRGVIAIANGAGSTMDSQHGGSIYQLKTQK